MSGEYTQAQLNALRAAYAKGITEYEANGERIRYASMAEMKKAIDIMQAALKREAGRSPRRFSLAGYNRR